MYLIERVPQSTLLTLLKIDEIKEFQLDIAASSKEEWQQEAARLAKQGKTEQADAIEATILQHKTVPWMVLAQDNVTTLLAQFTSAPERIKKDDKIKLLNYAVLYQRDNIIKQLCKLNMKTAFNLKRVQQHTAHNCIR